MDRRGPSSFFGPAFGWSAFLGLTIFHAEGASGFKPFLNLEALLLVAGGTLLCLGVSFPMGEAWRAVVCSAAARPAGDEEEARRWGEILRHGADSAVGMGGLATLLGMILMLSSIDDVSAVPRRMALALTAMFYGLTLSEAFFIPLARRVRGPDLTLRLPPPGGGQRRLVVGLGAAGGTLLSFFVLLYAVCAPLTR
jgi:flagellar motor component MotA